MFQTILFLVTVEFLWQGEARIVDLSGQQYAPRPFKNKIFEPEPGKYAFEITWGPVPNWDEEDPIIGYKFLLWEMHSVKKQQLIDGVLVDDSSPSEYAVGLPEVYVVSASNRRIVIKDVKVEVWYEYSGLAFTKNGEGPISSPVGVKKGGPEKKKETSITPSLANR